ncbi:MAG: CHASE2 domain-containing protein [Actinomycetota bacterium]
MRRTAWFKAVVTVLIALAVTGAASVALGAGLFEVTQLRLADALHGSAGVDPRIVVVGIDDTSLAKIGRWPFDRIRHADLIEELNKRGAALIGYDVAFSEPSPTAAHDEALAQAAAEAGNVVFVATATFSGRLGEVPRADSIALPIEEITDQAGMAHANIIPDPDGIVRALPPVIETPQGEFFPGLSFLLYQAAEGVTGPITVRPDGVQVGSQLVPTGRGHLMDINFADAKVFPPEYSFVDVLEGRVPDDAFEGKIVLVGATAPGLGDVRQTPEDKAEGQPGVAVHANALNTMLTGQFLNQEGQTTALLWVFGLSLLVALAVSYLRISVSAIVAIGLGVGYFLLVFFRFDGGTVMNTVYPPVAILLTYLATLAFRYFTEERERRRVTRVFGRYVAGDVVEEVLSSPENALATLEGASRPLSVLFADLRGFTAASEGAEPTDVVKALNVYLDAMTRAVNEERGTIDKFMGDCVMAFWGAPRQDSEHARNSVRAGMKMLDYIDEAVARGETAGLNVKGCGVGISTGEAVVGNIGSHERLDYTAIGDTVNTSSRLCGVAGAGMVVVTEECARRLGDGFRVADLPPLTVKGKAEVLKVYQVLREGQDAASFEEDAQIEATEEKGHFEAPRAKAAGYAPIEPATPAPDAES